MSEKCETDAKKVFVSLSADWCRHQIYGLQIINQKNMFRCRKCQNIFLVILLGSRLSNKQLHFGRLRLFAAVNSLILKKGLFGDTASLANIAQSISISGWTHSALLVVPFRPQYTNWRRRNMCAYTPEWSSFLTLAQVLIQSAGYLILPHKHRCCGKISFIHQSRNT